MLSSILRSGGRSVSVRKWKRVIDARAKDRDGMTIRSVVVAQFSLFAPEIRSSNPAFGIFWSLSDDNKEKKCPVGAHFLKDQHKSLIQNFKERLENVLIRNCSIFKKTRRPTKKFKALKKDLNNILIWNCRTFKASRDLENSFFLTCNQARLATILTF